jgi:ATP-binding cassette subfamily B protein
MVLLLLQGLLPGATVYLTRLVVNSLVAVIGTGTSLAHLSPVLVPIALMVGVLLLSELLQAANEWIRTMQAELVQDYVSDLIQKQSVAIDFANYESSEAIDKLDRARAGASGRSLALLESTGSLLQNSIALLTIAVILLPYGIWLPLILVVSAFPAFYVLLRLNRLQYQWSLRTTTDRRWLQYYELLLTNSVTAAEVRLFDYGDHIRSAYQSLRHRLRYEQLKLVRDQSLGRLGASVIALVISGIALGWMGWRVLIGQLTLGDLALFYQAFKQGQGMIRTLLNNLGQIYRNSLFVGDLFHFLQVQPQIGDPPQPLPVPTTLQQGIQFRHITFRYPGSQEAVLDNFNLTIPAGKIVAIVGDNGAGKSTLLKLLCRFYDPEAGSITLDGHDLRNFAVKPLRKLITVLFQSPIPYYTTVAENITLGDISARSNQAEIEAAAKAAGIHAKITRLAQGYSTMLGKLFPDGTDLSGGEWQRLALARAFLRQAPIIVLDEPTSAMDPWAEFDWLERFRKIANNRTTLVITHRFTLAMRADMIHVMRKGQIVESGSHNELLMKNGIYAESWRSQMQNNTDIVEPSIN